jgi:cell division protein FtsI/penicillin-binding protein 2
MYKHKNSVSAKDRIPLVTAIFILLAFSVVSRLFYLQVLRHGDYQKAAASQHSFKDTIYAKRGQIFAYDTISDTPFLLASNQSLDLLFINPKEIENKDEVISKLSNILGLKTDELLPKFDEQQVYVIIKRKLTKEQSNQVLKEEMKGVYLQAENWRFYPEDSLASSILGFVNNEGDGNYGIEQRFNDILRGIDGYLNEETDAFGTKIAFGNDTSVPATNGSDVYLTIDRYIQGAAEKYLAEAVKKFSADSGSVIVLDKKTGKILALANAPFFDPNKYTEVNDYNLFKNKAIMDLYEPGSVFKAITFAAGEDAGKITPDTTYNDTGKVVLDGNAIKNSDLKAHGVCTMSYVLEQSLNTGTTYVEQQLGKDLFYEYIKKFGFGDKTGIEFDGEAGGKVYKPAELNDHGYATVSFGQSISTTALQMIQAYATIANDGKMMQPYIVDKTVDFDGNISKTQPKEIRNVISEKAASEMKRMLIGVVEKGHGGQAKVAGYKIAGKTGTAQVVKEDGTGYEAGKNIGTFIGFPVADGANFVVLAKIDNPKGVQWAESTAAPVVGQLLDYLLKYYQIPTTEKVN